MKFFSISVVGFKIFYKIDSLVKQKRLCTDWTILFWSFPSLCIFCLPLLLSGQEQGWVHHWLLKKIKNQILFDPIIYIEDIEKNLQEKQRVSDYFIIVKKTYKCCVNIFTNQDLLWTYSDWIILHHLLWTFSGWLYRIQENKCSHFWRCYSSSR